MSNTLTISSLETVGDVIDLITENSKSEDLELSKHAQALLGPRRRGSTTVLGLESLPRDTKLAKAAEEELRNVAAGCACYCIEAPQLGGRLGAIPLTAALELGETIWLREGEHGTELYVDDHYIESQAAACDRIYVIVGIFKDQPAVFTWHPGAPLGAVKGGINKFTAVKLHNG